MLDLKIRPYGLIMVAAILTAWYLASKFADRFGLSKEQVEKALPWVIIFGFLGARLYFVLFEWSYFQNNLGEILQIWQGGLSIYGAIIGGFFGLLIFAAREKIELLKATDLAALVLPLAQAIGRWGNFFNQEAFGKPTDLPWKIYIEPQFRPREYLENQYFHPTFLYESLWDLGVFFILLKIATSLPFGTLPRPGEGLSLPAEASAQAGERSSGRLTAFYLILYGIGRFFIESIRLDSFFAGNIRVDQITSLAIMVLGLVILSLRK